MFLFVLMTDGDNASLALKKHTELDFNSLVLSHWHNSPQLD